MGQLLTPARKRTAATRARQRALASQRLVIEIVFSNLKEQPQPSASPSLSDPRALRLETRGAAASTRVRRNPQRLLDLLLSAMQTSPS